MWKNRMEWSREERYQRMEDVSEASIVELAKKTSEGPYRQTFHIQPSTGLLNDPNGFSYYNGQYHLFYQWFPLGPVHGVKYWYHVASDNLVDWQDLGIAMAPDTTYDSHGVFSGTGFVENNQLHLFYTGNTRTPDWTRIPYQCHAVMGHDNQIKKDAEPLISDSPAGYTDNFRDPKVLKQGARYYCIIGAETNDHQGAIAYYVSDDLTNWTYQQAIQLKGNIATENQGFMWECPDYFEIGDQKILSASVQGLTGGQWEERNVYQSGYFLLEGEISGKYHLGEYRLWDYGFDYYAPQSFRTEDGRIIQIGWMGMPDCKEYTNRTIEDGWQHCFTFPREIYIKDGIPCQRPVRELEKKCRLLERKKDALEMRDHPVYQAEIPHTSHNQFQAVLGEELVLEYREGRFEMGFKDQEKTSVSAGRGRRYVELDVLKNVRILTDTSSVEVFLNDGEYVFSTRYYPEKADIRIKAPEAEILFKEIVTD